MNRQAAPREAENYCGTMAELYPKMEAEFAAGRSVSLAPRGRSMLPLLVGGRDRVTLAPPQGRLKKFDIALYRREDGSFVLHRVIKLLPDGYRMRGDNQRTAEDIGEAQVLAAVSAFTRNGHAEAQKTLSYALYKRLIVIYRGESAFGALLRGIRRLFHKNKETGDTPGSGKNSGGKTNE